MTPDNAESQLARDRLEAVLENIVEGVVVIGGDDVIEFANQAALDVMGLPREAIVGKSSLELAQRFILTEPGETPIAERYGPGDEVRGVDMTVVRGDGVVRTISMSSGEIRLKGGGTSGQVATLTDVTESRMHAAALADSLRALTKSDAERQALLQRLSTAQEQERARIAEDLHDDVVQAMAAADMRIGMVRRRFPEMAEDEGLLAAEKAMSAAIARVSSMLFELGSRALETEGLSTALMEYATRYVADGGPQCRVDDRLEHQPDLTTRTYIFRIIQEALINVRKHARAAHVVVMVDNRNSGYHVTVQDDGAGFERTSEGSGHGHIGLDTMRDRANQARGTLRVESVPGTGTTVEFWIPEPARRANDIKVVAQ